ncbi:thiamine phosphate synthase [Pedobacter sp. P351]|uniref:thiamine phosphate synthase n=1 Tax=Pedobacter superstes TaxID=3133441 RepID=UPI0030A71E2C
MKKFIAKLHYLTQDLDGRSHIEQAQIACEAGCKWVQYRCFSKNDDELLNDLHQIAAICDDWGATLIVTDHAHLLDQADIQGVHIEDMEADFTTFREQIGSEKTLGASANTFEDIQRIAASGVVDYIGCGPFSLTDTKPNEYAILGIEGYKSLSDKIRGAGIEIPVLAVGGVRIEDVDAVMKTGVYGVAISAAVNKSDNPVSAFKEIYKKVY